MMITMREKLISIFLCREQTHHCRVSMLVNNNVMITFFRIILDIQSVLPHTLILCTSVDVLMFVLVEIQ